MVGEGERSVGSSEGGLGELEGDIVDGDGCGGEREWRGVEVQSAKCELQRMRV